MPDADTSVSAEPSTPDDGQVEPVSANIEAVLQVLTPEQQAVVKEWEKRTLARMTKSSQEASSLRQAQEGLEESDLEALRSLKADPALYAKVSQVMQEYNSGSLKSPVQGSTDDFNTPQLDAAILKLSKTAQDAAGFDVLKTLLKAVQRDFESQKVAPKLALLEQATKRYYEKEADTAVAALTKQLGQPLVDKYRSPALQYLKSNPNSSLEHAYRAIMEPDDLISAFGRKKEMTPQDKMKAAALAPSAAGASKPKPPPANAKPIEHIRWAAAQAVGGLGIGE